MSVKRIDCDLCKSKDFKIIYKDILDYETNIKIKVDLLKCNKCDLIQQSEIFSNKEIEKFYLEDYHARNYNKEKSLIAKFARFLRNKYYQRFIDILISKKIPKNIKILDFGSGDGLLAHQLIKNGYKNINCCDFFEPSYKDESTNYFHPNSISEYQDTFDAIFMLNSIEHLVSFFKDFNSIVNMMKQDSILILETPNFDSPDSNIFKKYWGGLHQPRHTYIWSKKSLIKHLAIWGFTSENIGTPQSAHWAISVQNFLSANSIFFKSILRNGRFPGYPLLVIIFLPLGIIQNFYRKESSLNIFARLNKKKDIKFI